MPKRKAPPVSLNVRKDRPDEGFQDFFEIHQWMKKQHPGLNSGRQTLRIISAYLWGLIDEEAIDMADLIRRS